MSGSEILPAAVLRNLGDKFYDKRKLAALEVERIVRDLKATGDRNQIRRIIDLLTQEFAYSVQHNSRNGGLIGLAATTIALGQVEVAGFLKDLMPPVLACLGDQDARVRYYACESVYNICKVARGQCLLYFNELFDALSKLAADPEISVKNGADLLDRLIKDIVGEEAHQATDQIIITSVSHRLDGVASAEQQTTSVDLVAHNLDLPITGCFSLSKFIPLLAERIYTVNPFTRSFLISWITVLDSIPELELITYLPDFLDGLIGFVSDPNDDVRMGARAILGEFLHEIRDVERSLSSALTQAAAAKAKTATSKPPEEDGAGEEYLEQGGKEFRRITIPYAKIVTILLPHTRSFADEDTQMIALSWLTEFVLLAGAVILSKLPDLISAVLPCLSHASVVIRRSAETCDRDLRKLVFRRMEEVQQSSSENTLPAPPPPTDSKIFDESATVNALTLQFLNEHEKTRVASLEWMLMLHKRTLTNIITFESGTFPVLLKTLSDSSEEVVRRDLQLLAQISSQNDEYFSKFIGHLLSLFSTDRRLLDARGSLIIRQLCTDLDGERIYRTFSETLEIEDDSEFASVMVQTLNLILVTAPELLALRKKLREFDPNDKQSLFLSLYRSWCHNAVATLCLCLMAQCYEHAASLIQYFSDMEISVGLLVQLDKLVQLLESPVFSFLRLQLLDPDVYPHLYKCLYGILMLIPQSSAFATLRNRLNSVNSVGMLQLLNAKSIKQQEMSPLLIHENSSKTQLMEHFRRLQFHFENNRKAVQAAQQSTYQQQQLSLNMDGAMEIKRTNTKYSKGRQ